MGKQKSHKLSGQARHKKSAAADGADGTPGARRTLTGTNSGFEVKLAKDKPQGLKPKFILWLAAARLKSCPDTKPFRGCIVAPTGNSSFMFLSAEGERRVGGEAGGGEVAG